MLFVQYYNDYDKYDHDQPPSMHNGHQRKAESSHFQVTPAPLRNRIHPRDFRNCLSADASKKHLADLVFRFVYSKTSDFCQAHNNRHDKSKSFAMKNQPKYGQQHPTTFSISMGSKLRVTCQVERVELQEPCHWSKARSW